MKTLSMLIILFLFTNALAGTAIIPENTSKNYGGHGGGGDINPEELVTVESLQKIEDKVIKMLPAFFKYYENKPMHIIVINHQEYDEKAKSFDIAQVLFKKDHPQELTDYSKHTIYKEIKSFKGIAFQDEPCLDKFGSPKDATYFSEKGPGYVCMSAGRLREKNIINKIAYAVVSPLLSHELIHRINKSPQGDVVAVNIQNDMAKRINSYDYYEEKILNLMAIITESQKYFSKLSQFYIERPSNLKMACETVHFLESYSRDIYKLYKDEADIHGFSFLSPIDTVKTLNSTNEFSLNVIANCNKSDYSDILDKWLVSDWISLEDNKKKIESLRKETNKISLLELVYLLPMMQITEPGLYHDVPLGREKLFWLISGENEYLIWLENKIAYLGYVKTELSKLLQNPRSNSKKLTPGQFDLYLGVHDENKVKMKKYPDIKCKIQVSTYEHENKQGNNFNYIADVQVFEGQHPFCYELRTGVYGRLLENLRTSAPPQLMSIVDVKNAEALLSGKLAKPTEFTYGVLASGERVQNGSCGKHYGVTRKNELLNNMTIHPKVGYAGGCFYKLEDAQAIADELNRKLKSSRKNKKKGKL